jgi:hypothetical protein
MENMMLNVQINRIHSGAVCKAIGEGLSAVLASHSSELPPSLLALMDRLKKLNLDAPPNLALKLLEPVSAGSIKKA